MLSGLSGNTGPSAIMGGSFTPDQVAGLRLWLNATAGTYQTVGGLAAAADADPVGQWQDQSGQANHAAQATSTKRGTLKLSQQNGLPAVRFDGVDDFLVTGATLDSDTLSVFCVAKPSSGGAMVMSTAFNGWGFYFTGTTYRLRFGKIGVDEVVATAAPSNPGGSAWQVREMVLDHVNEAFFEDGVANGSPAYSSSFTAGATYGIGARGPDNLLAGDIGELLVYNTAVSAANRALIETYLRSKWGTP